MKALALIVAVLTAITLGALAAPKPPAPPMPMPGVNIPGTGLWVTFGLDFITIDPATQAIVGYGLGRNTGGCQSVAVWGIDPSNPALQILVDVRCFKVTGGCMTGSCAKRVTPSQLSCHCE